MSGSAQHRVAVPSRRRACARRSARGQPPRRAMCSGGSYSSSGDPAVHANSLRAHAAAQERPRAPRSRRMVARSAQRVLARQAGQRSAAANAGFTGCSGCGRAQPAGRPPHLGRGGRELDPRAVPRRRRGSARARRSAAPTRSPRGLDARPGRGARAAPRRRAGARAPPLTASASGSGIRQFSPSRQKSRLPCASVHTTAPPVAIDSSGGSAKPSCVEVCTNTVASLNSSLTSSSEGAVT